MRRLPEILTVGSTSHFVLGTVNYRRLNMSRVQELQAELRVLEAFNDTTRATILRSMLEYEIKAEEKSHVNGIGRSSRS